MARATTTVRHAPLRMTILVSVLAAVAAFAPPLRSSSSLLARRSAPPLFSTPIKEDETKKGQEQQETGDMAMTKGYVNGDPHAAADQDPANNKNSESEDSDGLPWWWELVWKLDMMKLGEPGSEITFGDSANVFRTNIEQIYGGYPSLDGCPLAEGALDTIADGTMFVGLQNYYNSFGSPFKLCFGPKSFLVVSDPVQARHILSTNNKLYDKGILAEILEPIMGKGLIPADPETWSVRRRQIVPAFHQAWLEHMVGLFGFCNQPLIESLETISKGDGKAEMETYFCSVALDIIGLSVFNYNFGSVTKESPVIKAVYSALVESEHRSMTPGMCDSGCHCLLRLLAGSSILTSVCLFHSPVLGSSFCKPIGASLAQI